MLCLRNACIIFRKFSRLYYLYLRIKNWLVLFIYETFLVYKLDTFTSCKEVKHIMIMIIAVINIFLPYEIFHQQLQKISLNMDSSKSDTVSLEFNTYTKLENWASRAPELVLKNMCAISS